MAQRYCFNNVPLLFTSSSSSQHLCSVQAPSIFSVHTCIFFCVALFQPFLLFQFFVSNSRFSSTLLLSSLASCSFSHRLSSQKTSRYIPSSMHVWYCFLLDTAAYFPLPSDFSICILRRFALHTYYDRFIRHNQFSSQSSSLLRYVSPFPIQFPYATKVQCHRPYPRIPIYIQ